MRGHGPIAPENLCANMCASGWVFSLSPKLKRPDGASRWWQLAPGMGNPVFHLTNFPAIRAAPDDRLARPRGFRTPDKQHCREAVRALGANGISPALVISSRRRRFLRTANWWAKGLQAPVLSYEEIGFEARGPRLGRNGRGNERRSGRRALNDLWRGFRPQILQAALVVFLRVGAMMTLLPAFGEAVVPVRVRIALALAFYSPVINPPALAPNSSPPLPPSSPGAHSLSLVCHGKPLPGLPWARGCALFVVVPANCRNHRRASHVRYRKLVFGVAAGVDPPTGHVRKFWSWAGWPWRSHWGCMCG